MYVIDYSRMPAHIRKTLTELQTVTEKCSGFQLNVCLSYGGRDEIVQACRRVAEDAVSGRIESTRSIDEQLFSEYLTTTNGKPHLSLIYNQPNLTSPLLSTQLRPRPAHPNLGRVQTEQLPALAADLRRAAVRGEAVAGAHPHRPPPYTDGVRAQTPEIRHIACMHI